MTERHTIERYVGECFIKSAHVILSSRILAPANAPESAPSTSQRANHWFLLEVEGVERAKLELEPWRRDLSNPLVIEIYARLWGPSTVALSSEGSTANGNTDMLLERWVLQYTGKGSPSAAATTSSAAGDRNSHPGNCDGNSSLVVGAFTNSTRTYMDESSIYKRMIILIRSLHSSSRVLPAYRMYRACKRTKGEQFAIGYRISSNLRAPSRGPSSSGTASSAAQGGTTSFRHYSFAPIETPTGSYRVSLDYAPPNAVQVLEKAITVTVATSMPRIIPDYVGRRHPADYNRTTDRTAGSSSKGATASPRTPQMGSSPEPPPVSVSAPVNHGSRSMVGFMGSVGSTLMGMMPLSPYIRQAAKVGLAVVDPGGKYSNQLGSYRRGYSLNRGSGERDPALQQLLGTASVMLPGPPSAEVGGAASMDGGSWQSGAPAKAPVTRHCWSSKHMSVSLPVAVMKGGKQSGRPLLSELRRSEAGGDAVATMLLSQQLGGLHAAATATAAAVAPDGDGVVAAVPDGCPAAGAADAGSVGGVAAGREGRTPAAADGGDGVAAWGGNKCSGVLSSIPVSIPKSARTRSVADMQVIYDFPEGLQATPSTSQHRSVRGGGSTKPSHIGQPGTDISPLDNDPARAAASSAPAGPRGMLGLALQHEAVFQQRQQQELGQTVAVPLLEAGALVPVHVVLRGYSQAQTRTLEVVHETQAHAKQQQQQVAGVQLQGKQVQQQQQQQRRDGYQQGSTQEQFASMQNPNSGISGSSGSSGACAFAISCSPQLPFAFTPTGHSLSSLNKHFPPAPALGRCLPPHSSHHPLGPEGSSAGVPENSLGAASLGSSTASSPNRNRPYPDECISGEESVGVSGRDISALATIRRPSWSLSYSSSLDRAAPWMLPHFGGISPPVQDLGEGSFSVSMMSSHATPHQQRRCMAMVPYGDSPTLLPPLPSPPSRAGQKLMVSHTDVAMAAACPDGFMAQTNTPQAPLYYHSSSGGGCYTASLLDTHEDSEADLLPFALEEESMNELPLQSYSIGRPSISGHTIGYGVGDVAVGAFIRMLQEAPPLALADFGSKMPAIYVSQVGRQSGYDPYAESAVTATFTAQPMVADLQTALLQLQHSADKLKSYLSSS